MISRRDFLRGGAVAGLATTLPAGAVIAGSQSKTATFEAICDTRFEEGDQFLKVVATAAYQVHGLDADPGSIMPVMTSALGAGRPVIGLTTDAALLLAEQLALAEGYELSYKGIHKHLSADQVEHHLSLNDQWHASIEKPLSDAEYQWPEIIARLIPNLITDKPAAQQLRLVAPSKRALSSHGHLVSWVLRPAGTCQA
jgi:hypothetical protein